MPENKDCRSDYSKYDSMTTEELEEILRQDVDNFEDETEIDMLMYVAEVIRVRKGPDPSRKTPEEAFEIFKTHYMPTDSEIEDFVEYSDEETDKKKDSAKVILMPRWMRRLVSAVAVIAVIIAGSMTASALGYNIWEVVVQWTQETFCFVREQGPAPTAPEKDNHQEYHSLQDALVKNEIAVQLAPQRFPEGYELTDIKVKASPSWEMYLAIYSKGDQEIKVQIKRYLGADPQQIEQSDLLIEAYESDGIVYYLFDNFEQLRAVWMVENFECYISGELTLTEMKAIVDSIKE